MNKFQELSEAELGIRNYKYYLEVKQSCNNP